MNSRNTDAIQTIKSRISIADLARRYVEVRPVGSRLVAPCPFHQETKPSFSLNEEQGTFYCFGCQASGDIFDFYGRINGLDFRETLEQLAEEAGVQLNSYAPAPQAARHRSQKRDMLKMHEMAAAHFARNLRDQRGKPCRDYIAGRGLSPDIQEKFGLGWSLDEWQDLEKVFHRAGFGKESAVECGLLARSSSGRLYDRFRKRLMFPIRSLSGQVVAFGGRILPALAEENDAKYINSSDSPIYKKGEHLYGLFQARPSIALTKSIMLTEGYMDVLTLHQFGYTQAVGVLGTALTPDQVKRLSGFSSNIELMFDGDAAGRKAALRSCEMLLLRGLSCRVVLFPDPHDIDSLLRTEGPEAFENLRHDASDGMSFCLDILRAMPPKDAVDWARAFLAQVELPELFTHLATALATGLGLTEAELRGGVADRKNLRNVAPPARHQTVPKVQGDIRDREIMTFVVRYPQRLPDLRDYGADLALETPWARSLWAKLESCCRAEHPEEVFSELDPKEKQFWMHVRDANAGAPALDNENTELDALQHLLNILQTHSHMASVAAALRQGSADHDIQREYMRALREARGRRGDS